MASDERRSAPDSGGRTELGTCSKLHPQTLTCIVHTGNDVSKPQSLWPQSPPYPSVPQAQPLSSFGSCLPLYASESVSTTLA